MKKIVLAVVCVLCSCALCVAAAENKSKVKMTDEQMALQKKMLDKYDTDKDGKLKKEEKKQMTADEKKEWAKVFPKKDKEKAEEGTTKEKKQK